MSLRHDQDQIQSSRYRGRGFPGERAIDPGDQVSFQSRPDEMNYMSIRLTMYFRFICIALVVENRRPDIGNSILMW